MNYSKVKKKNAMNSLTASTYFLVRMEKGKASKKILAY